MMNLNRRREEIRLILKNKLPEFVIATGPDHPLLMRGADFFIGGRGLLTAVFSPSAEEVRRPQLLGNRLILSRLAMPPHTRNVLLLSDELTGKMGHAYANDFAVVLDWKERNGVAQIARDRDFIGSQRDIPEEITSGAKKQFSDIIQVTRLMDRLDHRRSLGKVRPDRDEKATTTAKFSIKHEVQATALAEFSVGGINSSAVNRLINAQTHSSYVLDSSIPYPRPELYYGLAVVDELPKYRNDPEKLIRAAAFGGWAIISRRQEAAVPNLINQLSNRRETRLRWQ